MGIIVHVCRVSWKQPISARDFVERTIVCCVLRLFFEKIKSSTVLSFLLPLFFFFHNNIPIPLFLRDLVWFIFRTHPPYFSFVYLCFQLQWNKKKKKPRMQPRTSSFVPCFVLVFFLTACNKIPPSLPYQGKAMKLFLRSQWITIKHSCNILAWHELCFFCHECGSGVSRRKLLPPLFHLH